MRSPPRPRPSGGRPVLRVRPAATTPNAIWTWKAVGTLTSGSPGGWLVPGPGPRTVGEPMHWLAGRVAVVTGASRGIGAATAAGVAAAGAHVVLAARDREALDRVASRIRHAGSEATPVPTDGSNDADVERLFAAAPAAGPVAALVCAAGVLTPAPFAETTTGMWEQTLRVNLTG